jgi:hypothetical protein
MMAAKIISLSERANRIDKETDELDAEAKSQLLEYLDEVRKNVESGDTISILFAEFSRDNDVTLGSSMDPRTCPWQAVGACEQLQRSLDDCFE